MQGSGESRMEAKGTSAFASGVGGNRGAAFYKRLRMSCQGGKRKTKG